MARVPTNSSYDTNAEPLIESLGWKKLDRQRDFQMAVMMFKLLNGLAPKYLQSMFKERDSILYSLSDSEGKLVVPKTCTNYLKNSFSYSGAVLSNSLPVGLRKISALNEFKTGSQNCSLNF